MKIFHQYLIFLFVTTIFSSCVKNEVPLSYPFGCFVETTRNGELRKFYFGGFSFDDRLNFYHNADGDTVLNVRLVNNIKGTNSENIHFSLAKAGKEFIRVYDLNEPDTLRKRFSFVFDERYLSKATYELDSTYPNTFELLFISEDMKQIKGKLG